tara:strand:+ start:459 stop:677 length:219 start_codon:yes stop_codon:yes gene_type:complete
VTLFGFCIEIAGSLYEAAAWALDVDDAFGVLHECYELEHMRCLDGSAEWEWCALAEYNGHVDLMWWLQAGEA